jgi:hypothetical protein
MASMLHIVTGPEDNFTKALRRRDGDGADCCDFNRGEPDYDDLLDRIFAADRVHVWSPESGDPAAT